MSRWARFFSRRKRMMEDLDQDIRDYIERETQDNIERGMSPEEAHYAALRKFGNVTRVKEDTWEVWSFVWLEQLWQDVRFGLRQLRRRSRLHGRGRPHAWRWALARTRPFSVWPMPRSSVAFPFPTLTGSPSSGRIIRGREKRKERYRIRTTPTGERKAVRLKIWRSSPSARSS